MRTTRRQLLQLVGGAAALPAVSRVAKAQTYPSRPIRFIVPFTPGSPVDASARVLTLQLESRLGQPVVIENRPGAGTTLGTKAAATATPDGYTLLFNGDSMGYYPVLYPKLDFDPLKDLAPIGTAVSWSHLMVVAPSVQAKSVAELVALAKAKPGELVFGFGLGTTPHILGESFKRASGAEFNFVPYRGGEQARADLLGGRVHINFAPVGNLMALIQDGKVRPLAFTGPQRASQLPDVPTMTESGFPQVGFNPDAWQGVLGPAGMEPAVVKKLNTAINESLKSPELIEVFGKLGFEPKAGTPEAFSAFLASEMRKWPPLLRAAGLTPV